mgnify:CR=1 FL=1
MNVSTKIKFVCAACGDEVEVEIEDYDCCYWRRGEIEYLLKITPCDNCLEEAKDEARLECEE